jgi:hypothetical protein
MNDSQFGGTVGDKQNEQTIFPLRNEDLVFSKNSDGILSCGYKVSNALLSATLGIPMSGGGGSGRGDKGIKKDTNKHKNKDTKNDNNNDVKNARIMEDLVVPSSLYYCRPINSLKVFNYKKGKKDNSNKVEKGKKIDESYSDNDSEDNVIEESLYDKLLLLVTADNRVKYDKKTRKHVDRYNKIITNKNLTNISTNDKDNKKTKNKKTKKVKFNL